MWTPQARQLLGDAAGAGGLRPPAPILPMHLLLVRQHSGPRTGGNGAILGLCPRPRTRGAGRLQRENLSALLETRISTMRSLAERLGRNQAQVSVPLLLGFSLSTG